MRSRSSLGSPLGWLTQPELHLAPSPERPMHLVQSLLQESQLLLL